MGSSRRLSKAACRAGKQGNHISMGCFRSRIATAGWLAGWLALHPFAAQCDDGPHSWLAAVGWSSLRAHLLTAPSHAAMTPVKNVAMSGMEAEMEPSSSSTACVSHAPPALGSGAGRGEVVAITGPSWTAQVPWAYHRPASQCSTPPPCRHATQAHLICRSGCPAGPPPPCPCSSPRGSSQCTPGPGNGRGRECEVESVQVAGKMYILEGPPLQRFACEHGQP